MSQRAVLGSSSYAGRGVALYGGYPYGVPFGYNPYSLGGWYSTQALIAAELDAEDSAGTVSTPATYCVVDGVQNVTQVLNNPELLLDPDYPEELRLSADNSTDPTAALNLANSVEMIQQNITAGTLTLDQVPAIFLNPNLTSLCSQASAAHHDHLSGGAIAGIVVGAACAVSAAAGVGLWLRKRNRRS